MTATIEKARELFIHLATTPLQVLIDDTALQREQLIEALKSAIDQISSAWGDAARKAAENLLRVTELYPSLDAKQILQLKDVRSSISSPFYEAAEKTMAAANDAWKKGVTAGVSHARRDASTLERDLTAKIDVDASKLKEITDDIKRNRGKAINQFIATVRNPTAELPQKLQTLANEYQRRANLSVEAAGTAGHAATKQTAAEDMGTKKMWVTRFGPGTCGTCAALHGSVKRVHEEFSHKANLGKGRPKDVYKGVLQGPPRHPNCRCLLVPYTTSLIQGGASPSTMRDFARQWERLQLAGVI